MQSLKEREEPDSLYVDICRLYFHPILKLCCFQDASPGVPILVFLSPGVDVAASVENLGKKLGFTAEGDRYASVSLGQGQEDIAMQKLTHAHTHGGWVLLQNIHLTMEWTSGPLEKTVDKLALGAHPDFRYMHLFLRPVPVS